MCRKVSARIPVSERSFNSPSGRSRRYIDRSLFFFCARLKSVKCFPDTQDRRCLQSRRRRRSLMLALQGAYTDMQSAKHGLLTGEALLLLGLTNHDHGGSRCWSDHLGPPGILGHTTQELKCRVNALGPLWPVAKSSPQEENAPERFMNPPRCPLQPSRTPPSANGSRQQGSAATGVCCRCAWH